MGVAVSFLVDKVRVSLAGVTAKNIDEVTL
ncbi:hypothetical protein V6Z11_D02G131300 [Gossypium hirsutum]